MSFVPQSIAQMKKMLRNMDAWLHAAAAYAEKRSFDPNRFLSFRLAPDQFELVRQVQSACDSAKFAAARLSGKEAPKHPDTETTMAELYARIGTCTSYLDTFQPADFNGAETRRVELAFMEGKFFLGQDFLLEMALPNFYFHVNHTYAILRHNGVELGKRDYLGALPAQDR
jgi:hypothetical protein